MSISDDTLTDQGTQETTHSSFNSKRTRHSSVPMTSKTGSTIQSRFTRHIPGKLMSVRLKKSQIDKEKDKIARFSDNFTVTLFLVRPNDQTLQDEFYRSNLVCQQHGPAEEGKAPFWSDKLESSDEDLSTQNYPKEEEEEEDGDHVSGEVFHAAEEPIILRHPPTTTTTTSTDLHLGDGGMHGMVRNRSEPTRSLSHMPTLSHSTYI